MSVGTLTACSGQVSTPEQNTSSSREAGIFDSKKYLCFTNQLDRAVSFRWRLPIADGREGSVAGMNLDGTPASTELRQLGSYEGTCMIANNLAAMEIDGLRYGMASSGYMWLSPEPDWGAGGPARGEHEEFTLGPFKFAQELSYSLKEYAGEFMYHLKMALIG